MRKWRVIYYILLFLIGFAPFLPVPYAPRFLHRFFGGMGSIIFIPIFLLLIFSIIAFLIRNYLHKLKIRDILFESIIVPAIFFLLIQEFNTLSDWRNQTTIWLNEGREVESFVSPFWGMEMIDCRKVSRPYEVIFKHNGASIEFSMLEYAPKRPVPQLHLDGNRLMYGDGIKKIYKENWYVSGSGSQYSLDWANCLTDKIQ